MRLLLGALLAARPEAVELEDLRVGEVNDLVEELTSGGAEARPSILLSQYATLETVPKGYSLRKK